MANRRFNQFFNTLHKMPVLLDCQFVVDQTSVTGVTGLKGGGIQAVYMKANSPSTANPNPAVGYIVVQLQDNYNRLFGYSASIRSPNSGSNLLVASAGLTIGAVYVITVLGTTTAAQWLALGVPAGETPAVGLPFVAKATSATGTGAVQLPASAGAGAAEIDLIGVPELSLTSSAPNAMGSSSTSYLIFRSLSATSSSVTTLIPAAPAAGSLIYLQLYLSNSNILVQGE